MQFFPYYLNLSLSLISSSLPPPLPSVAVPLYVCDIVAFIAEEQISTHFVIYNSSHLLFHGCVDQKLRQLIAEFSAQGPINPKSECGRGSMFSWNLESSSRHMWFGRIQLLAEIFKYIILMSYIKMLYK